MTPLARTLSAFESSYDELNPAQQQAVEAIEGPVMVIAGPGTGKTTILTLRIANILRRTDTAPENILALTFTESGAYAMRRKLTDTIGPPAYKVNIHTFHGFASSVIERYPDYFPRIIGSSVITEAEQIRIVEKIIQSSGVSLLRPYGDKNYYVSPVLREIQILKRENVSPERLRLSVEREEAAGGSGSKAEQEKLKKRVEKNRELAFVYERYEEELAARTYYDFEDMLLELIRAMEHTPEFKLLLQEQYQYILADEHQDANASQNRILELLSDFHESPNLFIVGDEKQAIYRFQGASLENFLYFTQKYTDAAVIDLEHNYRSHQGILDASHSLILKNPGIPGRERRKLVSLQMGSSPIFALEFPTIADERECVAGLIGKLIGKGRAPSDIAILYRDNRHADPMAAVLKAHGIPHRIESDHDVLREPDVRKIITLCAAVSSPEHSESLASALLLPELECDPADVAELCAEASRARKPLHSVIKAASGKPHTSIFHAYGRIVGWSRLALTLQFPDFLQRLIQETNLLAEIVAAPDSLDRLHSVQALYDHILSAAKSKKTFYLKDFMEYLNVLRDHGIGTRRTYAEHVSGVRLLTAHRAKGLEFGHVFIIHAVDGVWGNRSSRSHFTIPAVEHARNTGRIEDERRLFYVAMTRAREAVTVSYARADADRETAPAQFISEIDPACVNFEKMDVDTRPVHTARMFRPPPAETSVSILSPDFVKSKFLGQPLSVTHLNNYLDCPWKYFFVNLIRVPQAENKHQLYGTAMHAALRAFFEAYREERDFSKKQLIAVFKHHLERQPLSADDRRESLEKGKKALDGYWKTYHPSWTRRILTEYSVKGVEVPVGEDTLRLTGKLDKIEFLDDANVVVVDYKTGKPKSRNEIEGKTRSSDGNYKRQLAFYKLLVDADGRFNMRSGEIDFLEPNERGIYKKERFEIGAADVSNIREVIAEMARTVMSLSFLDFGCGEKDCHYCSLGKLLRRG